MNFFARNRGPERGTHVSALFDDPAQVELALRSLYQLGYPRDLTDVVVSRHAAEHFKIDARPAGRETFRFAAIGGLTGLIAGALISLIMVALPGMTVPGGQAFGAIAQLVGPNALTILGAAVGALFGALRRRRPAARHRRAAAEKTSILVVSTARNDTEAARIADTLAASGGRAVVSDAGPALETG